MAKDSKQVTLPAAAQNMAQQAVDHLPPDHLVFDTTAPSNSGGAATQPTDRIPDQALPHVPTGVPPPVALPDAAEHMSEHATDHLPDQFVFDTAFVGSSGAGSQPIDHVPDQAASHVPEVIPPRCDFARRRHRSYVGRCERAASYSHGLVCLTHQLPAVGHLGCLALSIAHQAGCHVASLKRPLPGIGDVGGGRAAHGRNPGLGV
jgi:hypothetical protein